MAAYKYFASLNNRYDLNLLRRSGEIFPFAAVSDLRYERCVIQHDLKPFQFYRILSKLDSDSYAGFLRVNGLFDIRGKQFEKIPQGIDAISYHCGESFRFDYDFLIWQKNCIRQTWDAIDAWGVQRRTGVRWRHDLIVAVRNKHNIRFDSLLKLNPRARFVFRYDLLKLYRERICSLWNAIPCDFLARQNILFDANRYVFAAQPIHHQSLVRPGWRVFARNIETDMLSELGFIDADREDRSLPDIFLPDGQYEISVLTSSLFWKDAADHSVRTIIVGDDTEITPLPTIYNLRSSVQIGTTLIQWSATKSELDDCVFGVWYGSESPVDTDRPPDVTIWYSSSMTEYQTTFEQHASAWVAVAAIKPGNETEKGKVHELFLDWSNTPPRAPDDVMVMDAPLPEFDAEIETRHEDDPFMTLWNG
ncbi:MAG TPA: hypothetical protein DEB39_07045 [Planctomycetaceae bacterium]|nr:hypothetical protein [Planctomycetaceae bacterium]